MGKHSSSTRKNANSVSNALLNETYGCVWKWSISIMWPSIGKMMINKGGFGVPYLQTNPYGSRVLSFHPQIISQLLQCHIHTPSHPCSSQNHMHYASRLWLYAWSFISVLLRNARWAGVALPENMVSPIPMTKMITIPIFGWSFGWYLPYFQTHSYEDGSKPRNFPFWVNKEPLYFTVLLSLVIYHPSNFPIIRKKIPRAFRPLPLWVLQPQTERRGDVAGCRCSKNGPILTEYVEKTKIG